MSLITTLAELHALVPLSKTDKELPNFDDTERKFVRPILGTALYAELLAATPPTPEQAALIQLCNAITARMYYAQNLAFYHTQLTHNGLRVHNTETSISAPRWAFFEIKHSLMDLAAEAEEELLLQLAATQPAAWDNIAYQQSIIANGQELSARIKVYQPYRTARALQPLFASTITDSIEPALGGVFVRQLIQVNRDGTATPEEKEVFGLLQYAAARLGMRMAALENNIRYADTLGWTVGNPRSDSPHADQSAASMTALRDYADQMYQSGASYIMQARAYLNQYASLTLFPLYFGSQFYVDPLAPLVNENKFRKGIFIL